MFYLQKRLETRQMSSKTKSITKEGVSMCDFSHELLQKLKILPNASNKPLHQ